MSHFQTGRPLRRFLSIWVGLVYFWGLLHLSVTDISAYKCWYNSVPPDGCAPLTLFFSQLRPIQIVEFTLLMLVYGALLWGGLAGKIPQHRVWLSFPLQAACVFAISLIVRQDNMVLSLYLILTIEAIHILPDARLAFLMASGSLLLFVFNELLNHGLLHSWTTALFSIWISTDYPALSLFLVGYLFLYLQLSHAHTRLATTHAELEEAHEGLAAAAAQIETLSRLTERQRLARDLHDTLSQGLVGLKLQLEAVDALLVQRGYNQAQEVVRQAMGRVQETLAEARGVIHDLRTEQVTQNFVDAVQKVAQRFIAATGILCSMDITALKHLPPALHEHVLRMVSEGLTNIARHAQAQQAWIRATRTDEMLSIEIRDDGAGFDPAVVDRQTGHYGLPGLRERAHLVGGLLEIQSAPGAGTTLRFALPRHSIEIDDERISAYRNHK